MNRKAMLAVSFGTSYSDAIERNIVPVEKALAAAFPERELRRAFTSDVVRRKLAQAGKEPPDDVPRALERLLDEGYTDVVIQPTLIINGEEFDRLAGQTAPFLTRFKRAALGTPLLTSAADYSQTVRALEAELSAPEDGEAVLLMGHGSERSSYARLEYALHDAGWGSAFVGAMKGSSTLDKVIRRLAERPGIRRVRLYPLLLAAGDHARGDMAGDGRDSWKSRLTAAGYDVTCILRGLGESPGVRELFVRHAREAARI